MKSDTQEYAIAGETAITSGWRILVFALIVLCALH